MITKQDKKAYSDMPKKRITTEKGYLRKEIKQYTKDLKDCKEHLEYINKLK